MVADTAITYTQALEIVRRHQIEPPVQTVPIANEFGINVFKVDNFPENISGKIVRDTHTGRAGSSGYSIYVNANHPVVRRRFTIAHEIGHFVLHRPLIGDGLVDDGMYRSGLSGGDETAANQFAADLLMPWHLVNPLWAMPDMDLDRMAETFMVSRISMAYRLKIPC